MHTCGMRRTQISLTERQRATLDAAAARTGWSISALIRHAVDSVYGAERSVHGAERSTDEDLRDMRRAFGAWKDRGARIN